MIKTGLRASSLTIYTAKTYSITLLFPLTERHNTLKKFNFFIDIDGTLINHGEGKISDAVISAILKAKESGSRFFINTARPYWLVPKEIFPDEIFDGICSGCGTFITYRGKVIYQNFLSDETVKQTVKALEKAFPPEFSMLIECNDTNYYYGVEIPWYLNAGFKKLTNADHIGAQRKALKVQKLSFNMLSGNFSYEMFDDVKDKFDVMIHPTYSEIVPKGFSKGAALQITEREIGIEHGTSVAIGDSLNDAEMFRCADISIAMGNAQDNVKALCDYVTDTCESDGVARAIEMLTSK